MTRPQAAREPKPKTPKTAEQKKASERHRAYHFENRDKRLQGMRDRYNALSPAAKLLKDFRMRARPSMPKPGSKKSKDYRVMARARAYCEWSDIDEVVRIYMAAYLMTELFGEAYVVDHAVPLNSPLVSGLHTHTNLYVITQRENALKGNWIWPQMPPITQETMKFLAESHVPS